MIVLGTAVKLSIAASRRATPSPRGLSPTSSVPRVGAIAADHIAYPFAVGWRKSSMTSLEIEPSGWRNVLPMSR